MKSTAGRWIVWSIALLVSFGGAWVSWDLTVNHGTIPGVPKVATSQPTDESLLSRACTSLPIFDCEEAAESPWAVFPFGSGKNAWLHTSALGLGYFTGVICWLLLVGWPSPSRWWVQMIPVLATGVGLGISIRLEYVMWTQFSKPCLLCISSHVATLLLFVLFLLLWPRESRLAVAESPGSADDSAPRPTAGAESVAFAGRWPSWWTLGSTVVFVGLAVTATVTVAELGARARSTRAGSTSGALASIATPSGFVKLSDVELLRQDYERKLIRYLGSIRHGELAWQLAPRMGIPIQGRPSKGPATARHTVVIFSDFQCPACRTQKERFEAQIEPLFAVPSSGGVRVVFKHFPLCLDCNPYAGRDAHPSACAAAYAAEAAFALGGDDAFWKMHDLLFRNQHQWVDSLDFTPYAKTLGLDVAAFEAAMKSDAVRAKVKTDIEDGSSMGTALVQSGRLNSADREYYRVNSTPTYYLDDKYFASAPIAGAWKRILFQERGDDDESSAGPGTSSSLTPPATGPASTQPGDLAARVAQLEIELNKAKSDLQLVNREWARAFSRYDSQPEHAYLAWQLSPPMNLVTQGRPARGPDNARHTVVLFEDFQSPLSRMFSVIFERSIFSTGASPSVGGIRLVFKHWPAAPEFNSHLRPQDQVHVAGGKAACAAEAAYALGGDEAFWRMRSLLYEKQRDWEQTLDFAPYARQLGLDEAKFQETMNSPAIKARVKADVEEGANLGQDLVASRAIKADDRDWIKVDRTPAAFVDGKRLYSLQHGEAWNRITGYVPRPKSTGAPTSRPAVSSP